MPDIYIPRPDLFLKIQNLMYGFWLDVDDQGECVLILKLEASLLDAIIYGKPIHMVIRNPNYQKYSYTIYIYDKPDYPLFFSEAGFGKEDKVLLGFDDFASRFVAATTVRIALFNELSHCIFTTCLEKENTSQDFDKWLFSVYNSADYGIPAERQAEGHFFPETIIKGFQLNLNNTDHSGTEKMLIASPQYGRMKETATYVSFNHDDYKEDGKHGYHQELSIANNFARFFEPEVNLFINPFLTDDTEFTDFVIVFEEAAMLIESKYIISDKPNKRNALVSKAIRQLNSAEQQIIDRKVNLYNAALTERLNKTKYILKVCLLNSKTALTENNSQQIMGQVPKEQLPFFTSVTTFFNFLTALQLKNPPFFMKNIFFNIKRLLNEFMASDSTILYFTEFTIEGLTTREINELGAQNVAKK